MSLSEDLGHFLGLEELWGIKARLIGLYKVNEIRNYFICPPLSVEVAIIFIASRILLGIGKKILREFR